MRRHSQAVVPLALSPSTLWLEADRASGTVLWVDYLETERERADYQSAGQ